MLTARGCRRCCILAHFGARSRRHRLLRKARRLVGHARALRRRRGRVCAGPELVVPLAALDAPEVALQPGISVFLGAKLVDNLVAVRGIELADEFGDEVLVLQRLLDGGQGGTGLLPLARVGAMAVCVRGLGALLVVQLFPQAVEVEVAESIGAQAAALVGLVVCDVRVLLQQVRDLGKDIGADAVGAQTLEHKQRLEGGVGRPASSHPTRALGRVARWAVGEGTRGRGRQLAGDSVRRGSMAGRVRRWSA